MLTSLLSRTARQWINRSKYIGISRSCELPPIEIGGFLLHRPNFPCGSQPYHPNGWSRQSPALSALRSVTGIHRRCFAWFGRSPPYHFHGEVEGGCLKESRNSSTLQVGWSSCDYQIKKGRGMARILGLSSCIQRLGCIWSFSAFRKN